MIPSNLQSVMQIFYGPRCRFPIQLELLEPAELIDKMCDLTSVSPHALLDCLAMLSEKQFTILGPHSVPPLVTMRHQLEQIFCLCRMPSEDYFPAFDLRDLATVEELEWATGGLDVTGGKQVEINVFSRERLEDRKVRLGWARQMVVMDHGVRKSDIIAMTSTGCITIGCHQTGHVTAFCHFHVKWEDVHLHGSAHTQLFSARESYCMYIISRCSGSPVHSAGGGARCMH